MIRALLRSLRILLFLAAGMLVANDVARLCFSLNGSQLFTYQPQEEKNESSSFSLMEEEVKHKETVSGFAFPVLAEGALETSVEHLIKDDDVRHLAYLPVFSPPPDQA